MFATGGPCVPKSSVVGAVVEMLQAFWIVIFTGMVLVTVAAKGLVDARPSVTRMAVQAALVLMLILKSPLRDWLWVPDFASVVEVRSTPHRVQVRGLEQAVCQAQLWSLC